jgi:hypothetical protein|tara:strand:+ start:384 stop:2180 length:1797 start_codon:yes stop_codon:yes gene_type:complete
MSHNTIDLVDLDFHSIKNSLKNFLRDNDQFSDYDFEGSNINLLIELLAANGYRTAFYQNMVLNESFLDSAVLRNSVLSRSKELNYLPRSAKSTKARVRVVFDADGTNAPYTIAKGSTLTSLVKNDSFVFSIPETLVVASANNTYEFSVDIFEGYYVNDSYTYGSTLNDAFKVTNRNVDTDSLTVTVYEDGNQVGEAYIYASTLLDLSNKSKVYFLQPVENGFYEVVFGDNNIGRMPKTNSTIVLDYRLSTGADANGAREFTLNFDPTGNDELTSSVAVNTLQNGLDGTEEESIDSIKYNAPRHFQVQERAVVASDYSSIMKKQFPEIRAIHAYGGEDLTPPIYGRVYISVDIKNVEGLPDSKKVQYANFMKSRTTFGIVPFFQSPSFTYIHVTTDVRYNVNTTTNSKETLRSLINNAILKYRDDNLGDFNTTLRQSKLECEIDFADTSIISSVSDIYAYKKLVPTLGELEDHTLTFGVPLRTDLLSGLENSHPANLVQTVSSSEFYYKSEPVTIDDDGLGVLWIMRSKQGFHEKLIEIGSVDYTAGEIMIKNLKVDSYIGDSIKIRVRPEDPDVSAKQNNVVTIEESEIVINLEEVRI